VSGSEVIIRPAPSLTPAGSQLVIPTVTLFDGSENLRILSAASVACVLSIYLRMRRDDGTVEPMAFTHTPNSDRSVKTQDYPIGAGVLLNLVIVPTTGAPRVGECFVQATIIRGLSGATIPMGVLAQDYTTARQPVAWPGMPLRRSTEGPGALRTISNHSQTGGPNQVFCPAGALWQLDTVMLELNTLPSAMPDRIARFAVISGALGKNKAWAQSTVGQPNGVIKQYMIMAGSGNIDDSTSSVVIMAGPGPIGLVATDSLYFDCTNVDGLDTLWIYAQAREWLEVA